MAFEHLDSTMRALIETGQYSAAEQQERDMLEIPKLRSAHEFDNYCEGCKSILHQTVQVVDSLLTEGNLDKQTALGIMSVKKAERAGCTDCKTS